MVLKFDRLRYMQAIKNWRLGRPGNEARIGANNIHHMIAPVEECNSYTEKYSTARVGQSHKCYNLECRSMSAKI